MSELDGWSNDVRRGYDVASGAYRGDVDAPVEYRQWCDTLGSLLAASSKVIDLGCGCGVPMARWLVAAGHRVTGVDFSEAQIARARRLVPDAAFVQADLAEVGFADGSVDAVVMLYSIIHVPLAAQPVMLERIGRWLRPGGVLLLTAGVEEWTGSQDSWLGSEATMRWSQASMATYRGWLTAAGFEIEAEEIIPDGASSHSLFWARRR